MDRQQPKYLLAAVVELAMLGAGCGSINSNYTDSPVEELDEAVPMVELTALTPAGGDLANQLTVSVEPAGNAYIVLVRAAANLPECGELFFGLSYDPSQYHAIGLATTASSGSTAVHDRDFIGLAHEVRPGQIDIGLVRVGSAGQSADRSDEILAEFELLPGAATRATNNAQASSSARARNFDLHENGSGQWVLEWDYTNPGDTNQDGEVTISDISLIGMYYHEQLADDYDDPLRHVDSDQNGEINLGDLTAIGQNYGSKVLGYRIEISDSGSGDFVQIGELQLSKQGATATCSLRFAYALNELPSEGSWYRVVPIGPDQSSGAPSEAISSDSRMLTGIGSSPGQRYTVTVSVRDLAVPIAQLNMVRVVYPAGFTYVPDSYNVGSLGGDRDGIDGIWASFASAMLSVPESLISEWPMPDGSKALELNVTVAESFHPAATTGYGDLLNFQLESDGSGDLSLQFQTASEDGRDRTYYQDSGQQRHYFGSSLSMTVE